MKKFFLVLVIIVAWIFFVVEPSQDELKITNYSLTEAQPISEIAAGPKILVLNYHQVKNGNTYLSVHLDDFDAQMNYLVENGYIAITPDALLSALEGEFATKTRADNF